MIIRDKKGEKGNKRKLVNNYIEMIITKLYLAKEKRGKFFTQKKVEDGKMQLKIIDKTAVWINGSWAPNVGIEIPAKTKQRPIDDNNGKRNNERIKKPLRNKNIKTTKTKIQSTVS